jgi:DNA-binding NarL/FixJ family response regulator
MSIRVLLVDDHMIFRQCVRHLLGQQSGIDVVGEAEDGRVAVDLVRELSPDAVVMDMVMKSMNGIDAARLILSKNPGVKVIALSMHGHSRFVREALTAGVSAYLLKECAFSELVEAIRMAVERNQVYLSPGVSHVVVDGYLRTSRGEPQPRDDVDALTPREREILQLIAEGSTSREIAQLLSVSTRTVENHRANLMKKLRADSLAELVKYAVREGFTPP